jgi:hypothetical protein
MAYVLIVYIFIGIYISCHSLFLKNKSYLDVSDWAIAAQKIKQNNWKILRNFSVFPLIFILSYSFATVKRIYDFHTDDSNNLFWLSILTAIGTQSRGFFNGIAYAITQNVSQLYLDRLNILFGSCRNKSSAERLTKKRSNGFSYIAYYTSTDERDSLDSTSNWNLDSSFDEEM